MPLVPNRPPPDDAPTPDPTGGDAAADGSADVFRRLVEGVQDYAIFLLTPEGTIASWNVGAERIKGYAADEAIGRPFSIFYTPEARASGGPAEALRLAAERGHFESEGWRVRKDGQRFWAQATLTALRDADGALTGYSKVTRDLSERRAQERRLRDSERSLRLLVESVQDYAIFSLDPQGFITSWNLGAQRIKGYRAAEAIGRHFSIFYPPDAVARGWPQYELARALEAGRFEDEGWRVRKDGTRIWANVIITALVDDQGTLVGYAKVTRDLTERRAHEEALREREENLRLLVEGVRDHAMFLLDAAGRIRSWNAGAERLLGHRETQAIGQDAALLYLPADRAAGRPQAELASVHHAGFLQVEGWRLRADGSSFFAEVSTTVLQGSAGKPRGLVQIMRDLTERRRVEALESEGRRVQEFIAMLSHELRNPLTPIRNAVALLRKVAEKPEAAWCADLIARQVEHMSRLVDDLLDASRITSGKIRLEPSALDLNTLVRTAADSMRPAIAAHDHTLELALSPAPVMVTGDSTRLTQVLVNLLGNAAKYTPDGGRIRVAVGSDGSVATLQVSDNGLGMGEALLQRAFDPFVQGDRALDRAEGGLGIGLTLVKRIVELHGGSVSVASAGPGKGTTFTATLPLTAAFRPVDEGAPMPPPAPAPAASAGSVLVVDDNPDAADSLAMVLRLAGYEVRVAHDGPRALALAAEVPPRIVLLDLGLPGMNGLEVAQQLRNRHPGGDMRLIAITGYGQDSDRRASADAGFDVHLTKPVDPDLLLGLLG